ncbi:Asp23/Gls24 family envelope stress response protein [Anaerolentibacter hominis]|uniref:Asp23/Gls24 family envelope stress response protein n=1 Tax=Anaerolentibacter hominis TaxID=3079009 RepID=UPI0031B87A0B
MNKEETNTNYNIHEDGQYGEIRIADEVVAIIAGLAAMEVEGVAAMAGNATRDLISKLGMKNLSKGVKVEISDEGVLVDLSMNMAYGYSIPDVCRQVQEKVNTAIENMTGLKVTEVNIHIAGVQLENQK